MKLTITPTTASVAVGETTSVRAIDADSPATNPVHNVAYRSSNESVATVDQASGLITGVSVGSAQITAVAGGQEAACSLNVTS
jgi:uncharacterized protein YjdB